MNIPQSLADKCTFITAIDTDAGKTYAVGALARFLKELGVNVITMKLAQTGCVDYSEDIEKHRELMKTACYPEDREGHTCPYIFPFPASPHLSAQLAEKTVRPEKILESIRILAERYEHVLIEGVGGLAVPLTLDYTLADFLQDNPLRTILVSSAKLGSINHTLLTLEAAKNRNIPVQGILYNEYIESTDFIREDSKKVFAHYLKKFGFPPTVCSLPAEESREKTDYMPLLNKCWK